MSKGFWLDLFWRDTDVPRAPLPRLVATRRQAWVVGSVCALIFTVLYGFTAAPSIGAGHDSAELTACCITQGVPHSPGYPLFAALGWLAAQLPIGTDPAYRVNLLSALELGGAMGFLGAALCLAVGFWPAWVSTLLAGTCTAIWRQGVVGEVFALHLFILCMLLWLAVLWECAEDARRREILLATSFLLGCALAHQHIIAVAAPSFLIFGLWRKGRGRPWGFSWLCLPIFLAAWLLPYALQMVLAQQKPDLNWENPSNYARMVGHFLRKSYGTGVLNEAALKFDSRAGEAQVTTYFISLLRTYYPFPVGVLLLFALDSVAQRPRQPRFWLFALLFGLYGPWFGLLGNQPTDEFHADLMERFYSSSMIGAAGLLAFGVDWLLRRPHWVNPAWVPALLLLPLYTGFVNWEKSSQRNQYHPIDLLTGLMAEAPPRSLFFINGDMPSGVASYLRLVHHKRSDVLWVLPGLAASDWFLETLPAGLAQATLKFAEHEEPTHENAMEHMVAYARGRGRPVYTNGPPKIKGTFLRVGLSYRHFLEGETIWPDERTAEELLKNFAHMEATPRRGDYRLSYRQPFWVRYCIEEWIGAYKAVARGVADFEPQVAKVALDRVVEMEMGPSFDVRFNRAGLLLGLKQPQQALEDYELCDRMRPNTPMVLKGISEACRQLGELQKADHFEQRYRELAPKTEEPPQS